MADFSTRRLALRPLSLDDVDALVALDADPEVMRFINGGNPTPREEVAEIVADTRDHRWAAHEKATGAFVGWFALRPTDDDPAARELGYRLRRDAWGQGYATEGSRALIEMAFTELGARRVWAQTMTVNTPSRRVMERCGLRYVRTFYADWPATLEGTEQGGVVYELVRQEWGVRTREAVRAVLVDPAGAVLLMRVVERGSQERWWLTPGGGIDGDETPTAALCRELREEIGHALAEHQLGPAVWHRHVEFRWNHRPIHQHETYYLVETERFEPEHCLEGDASLGWQTAVARWWTTDELRATTDNMAPRALADLLDDLQRIGPPPELRLVD